MKRILISLFLMSIFVLSSFSAGRDYMPSGGWRKISGKTAIERIILYPGNRGMLLFTQDRITYQHCQLEETDHVQTFEGYMQTYGYPGGQLNVPIKVRLLGKDTMEFSIRDMLAVFQRDMVAERIGPMLPHHYGDTFSVVPVL